MLTMQNRPTFVFSLLLFGLGLIAGASINNGFAERRSAGPGATVQTIVDRFLARKQAEYAEGLDLTPGQLAATAPALEATRSELMVHQTEARKRILQIMEDYRRELRKELTPAQREILDRAEQEYLGKTSAQTPAR